MRNHNTSQGLRKPLSSLKENSQKPKTSSALKHQRTNLSNLSVLTSTDQQSFLKIEPQNPCFENI